MNFLNFKSKRGFTLIETMVAISIFTFSVLSLVIVLSSGLANANYAKKKLVAAYLAQEGIEFMRNMRDTYVLYEAPNTNGWNDFQVKIAPCDESTSKSCYFDDQALNFADTTQPIIDVPIIECVSFCPNLLYNSSTGRYSYAVGGNDSGYLRKIEILNVNDNEVKVTSTVYYATGSGVKSIAFSDHLFDWAK